MGCCDNFCCVMDCGFCCILDFCSDTPCSYHPKQVNNAEHAKTTADEIAEMKDRARFEGRTIGNEVLASIDHTVEIADMKNRARSDGNDIDGEVSSQISSSGMKELIATIRNANNGTYGGKKLNIDVDSIERELEKLREEIRNFIGERLDERLVETDRELSVILQERNAEKRKKNFDAFYAKIHKQAVLDLAKKVEEVIAKQFAIVNDAIQARLSEVNSEMDSALKNYQEAELMMEKKSDSLKDKQVQQMYKVAIADVMLDELKESA